MSGNVKVYQKIDYLFILSLRDKHATNAQTITDLQKLCGGEIEEEEDENRLTFRNIMSNEDYVESLREEGWFKKTYKTVLSYAKNYTRRVYNKHLVYSTVETGVSDKELITRLMVFCCIKNMDIFFETTKLSTEQKNVVNATDGIIVVNSGPGTGKTTAAIYKTKNLINEGVIVISYTNVTVDHFAARVLSLVDDEKDISKDPGSKVYICTIDKLGSNFLPTGTKYPSKTSVSFEEDFDKLMKLAAERLNENQSFFQTLKGDQLYKHIIVDEAQDSSSDRHAFLMKMYKEKNFKSITFLGDPRQRLNTKGGVDYEILIKSLKTNACHNNTVLFEFTRTYRFKNPNLLKLCNALSSKREHKGIHVELKSEETVRSTSLVTVIPNISTAVNKIEELVKGGVQLNEIYIVSPTLHRNNSITKQVSELQRKLEEKSIHTNVTIINDTIYVTTIHGVKGLEADHVFFMGSANYPKTFSMVYDDPNDGDGMNFVVNTRAKQCLYYISNEKFEIPCDVPLELTVNGKASENITYKDPVRFAIRSDLIERKNAERFRNVNMLHTYSEKIKSFLYLSTESYTYETISALLCLLKGKNVFQSASNVKEIEDYSTHFITGRIYDFYDCFAPKPLDCICVKNSDLKDIIFLSDPYDHNDIENHKMYAKLMTRKSSTLSGMDKINDVIMSICDILGESITDENMFKHSVVLGIPIRAPCVENDKICIIFTEIEYIVSYYKSKFPGKDVYYISFTEKTIFKIQHAKFQPFRYLYMIKALYKSYTQDLLIRTRNTTSMSTYNQNCPLYFIDSEFQPVKENKRHTIYDYAIVDIYDPYSNRCSMIDCGEKVFNQISYRHEMSGNVHPFTYDDFKGSPTIDEFILNFLSSVEGKNVSIHYYHTCHDIAPFYELFMEIDAEDKKIVYEYKPYAELKEVEFPVKFVNMSNKTPKLATYYAEVMNANHMDHIETHYALDDALLLMTIYRFLYF